MTTNRARRDENAFWYNRRRQETVSAASVVLKAVKQCIPMESALDVGCGTGTWLGVAKKLGARRILGLDGPHVPIEYLDVEQFEFRPTDLASPPKDVGLFDLAICLEVAEHLEADASDSLLDLLANSSENIIFSAAIPGQGGNGHINEQWQESWILRFEARGYYCYDFVRPLIWARVDVPSWYCQNIFLLSKRNDLSQTLSALGFYCLPDAMRNLVHPRTLSPIVLRANNPGIKRSARLLKSALVSKCRRVFLDGENA
ncbi:class I SAM-dependent methyltransferase [Candidatus Filomicrobium marinum]|nr:class I SAM-dependent methyltransferase [Candidatus Filomicrobium marinum]